MNQNLELDRVHSATERGTQILDVATGRIAIHRDVFAQVGDWYPTHIEVTLVDAKGTEYVRQRNTERGAIQLTEEFFAWPSSTGR